MRHAAEVIGLGIAEPQLCTGEEKFHGILVSFCASYAGCMVEIHTRWIDVIAISFLEWWIARVWPFFVTKFEVCIGKRMARAMELIYTFWDSPKKSPTWHTFESSFQPLPYTIALNKFPTLDRKVQEMKALPTRSHRQTDTDPRALVIAWGNLDRFFSLKSLKV